MSICKSLRSRFEVRGSRFEVRGSRFEKFKNLAVNIARFFYTCSSGLTPRQYLAQGVRPFARCPLPVARYPSPAAVNPNTVLGLIST
ncbi:hypothetical protein KKI34_17080 [Pseudoalteromonas tetraodonis]|uniref:hypothetical protein n=1 Tax=Pseudoalteromonas tetraodonis TaxID=43659 RepID=UPI001BDE76F8|nr:hypothetical protein [Pseudoalteromonas tetraodonis]MBT2153411.1 hypothetical protein [Pseudoalteromonas tetraodonis]